MSAYIVFIRDKMIDPKEMEIYGQKARIAAAGHTIKPLAIYGRYEVVEGPDLEGVVIIEFADMDAAKAWYHSPAYQDACTHRFKGANYRTVIVEGV